MGIDFGQCLPTVDALKAGNTCRTGKITDTKKQSNSVFNLHAYADTFQEQQRYNLPEGKQFTFDTYNCRPTRIGVPLGRTVNVPVKNVPLNHSKPTLPTLKSARWLVGPNLIVVSKKIFTNA